MGSSRLPGKVLADLAGEPMLARVVARVAAAARVHGVVVATTEDPADDAVVRAAARLGAASYRGPEADVLARYLGAARAAAADAVVRVTADCPLLDPEVVDRVVAALGPEVDYASNTHQRTFPQGLDVEALHRDTLERVARLAASPAAREHVTAFLREAPELFRTRQVQAPRDDSDLRWTVDTEEDLQLVRALYGLLGPGSRARPYHELVAAVRARPALRAINAHVVQRPWSHHGG